jgi:hypothetical protein
MSGWQPKEGSGSLFKNKDRTADNHPVSKGDIMLGGVVYEIAAWKRTTKGGEDFLSLSGKPKEQRQDSRQAPPQRQAQRPAQRPARDLDDDIPF